MTPPTQNTIRLREVKSGRRYDALDTARQALAAEFTRIYGPMTEPINRDAANHAGAPERRASQVLTAIMPVLVKAVGKVKTNLNDVGFWRQRRNMHA